MFGLWHCLVVGISFMQQKQHWQLHIYSILCVSAAVATGVFIPFQADKTGAGRGTTLILLAVLFEPPVLVCLEYLQNLYTGSV